MKLKDVWVRHRPDWDSKCQDKRPDIKAEDDCECGITERHKHCPGCGGVISKGDWSAKPIAEWVL